MRTEGKKVVGDNLLFPVEKILIRIPAKKKDPPFECEIAWDSLEAMLTKYDSMPNAAKDRKKWLRLTEMIALQQAGSETDDPFDVYRPTRYKRILRSVLRRRSNRS